MEKVFKLLVLILLTLSCNNEDDGDVPIVLDNEILYTIEVGSNIYTPADQESSRTGHVYLTDYEGELIKDTSLLNDNNYIIETDYDYTENSYDVTFESKLEFSGNKVYSLKTFIDVSPMTISMIEDVDLNPNNEHARITILNIGLPSDVDQFFSNNTHNGSCTTANGGYCDYNVSLQRVPDNIYSIFNKNGESFNRYLWFENVSGATEDTVEFDNIPIITESELIVYPPHDFINTTLYGYLTDDPERHYRLSTHSLNSDQMESEHFFPQNIFDGYKVDVLLSNSNMIYYSSRRHSNVVNTYILPAIDFQVTNSSVENYEIQSSDDFDYYSVHFSYLNVDEGLQVNWQIYGEGEEFISFSLPKLADIIFDSYPNFSTSELEHSVTRLYKIEGISTYEDYIHTIIVPQSEVNDQIELIEYVGKE